MASYAGIDLGLVMVPFDGAAPHQFQRNAYPAVNGVELLRMGARGWNYALQVFFTSSSLYAFVGAKSTLYTYQAAGTGNVYVDAEGNAHAGVILMSFTPEGPRYNLGFGAIGQRFTATFFYPGA